MFSGNDEKHLGHEIFRGSVSERIGEREGKGQHITCKVSPCGTPSRVAEEQPWYILKKRQHPTVPCQSSEQRQATDST